MIGVQLVVLVFNYMLKRVIKMKRIIVLTIILTLFISYPIIATEMLKNFNLETYQKLYAEKRYKEVINGLIKVYEQFSKWTSRREDGEDVEPIKFKDEDRLPVNLLIADSYFYSNNFTHAIDWYMMIAEAAFDSYAIYRLEVLERSSLIKGKWWTIPPDIHEKIYNIMIGSYPLHEKTLFKILRKLFDDDTKDGKQAYFKKVLSSDKNDDWITQLIKYLAGEQDYITLFSKIPEKHIGLISTYVGLNFELNGEMTSAMEMYSKALEHLSEKSIEIYLVKNRLGMLTFEIIYSKNITKNRKNVLNFSFQKANLIKSSSCLFENNKLYPVGNVRDNNPTTAWVEGKSDNGVGEWIEFYFDLGKSISSIKIINGYGKNGAIYQANNRVKRIKISFCDNTSFITELEDGNLEPQKVMLPETKNVKNVKITILEVYNGTKYNDTCISEVSFE